MEIDTFVDPNHAVVYAVYIDGQYVGDVCNADILKAMQDASTKYGGAERKIELKPK